MGRDAEGVRGQFWEDFGWAVTQRGLERHFLEDFGMGCDAEGAREAIFWRILGGP